MSTNALSKKFISSSLAKEEINFEMIFFISLKQLPFNMLLKRVQRLLYNFGLPFTSIVVLQTINYLNM
jgi:hypothetical protein